VISELFLSSIIVFVEFVSVPRLQAFTLLLQALDICQAESPHQYLDFSF